MSEACTKRLMNELRKLPTNAVMRAAGWSVGQASEADLLKWQGHVKGPTGTPYEGGTFYFTIHFDRNYPWKPPRVKFTTPLYHPMVDRQGSVCHEWLHHGWVPRVDIGELVQLLKALLHYPLEIETLPDGSPHLSLIHISEPTRPY